MGTNCAENAGFHAGIRGIGRGIVAVAAGASSLAGQHVIYLAGFGLRSLAGGAI